MQWLRKHALAIASFLLAAMTGACAAYAATESRIAVLEEKVKPIDEVRENVWILCSVMGAKCVRGSR